MADETLPPAPPAPAPPLPPSMQPFVAPGPVRLCASGELAEKGKAVLFEVMHFRQKARGFALRFDGKVVGYLNRCVHVPTEMDWQPGEFLDSRREYILCSIHGAAYQPSTGRCVAGPCGRGGLTVLEVEERDGHVYWQPTRDTREAPAAPPEPSREQE